MSDFQDPQIVAKYAEGPARIVPGYDGLLRMTTLLLAECVPTAGRVLVLGAGGGLELRAFASAHSDWSLDGVDPSAEMLKLAESVLNTAGAKAQLTCGDITAAPPGPYDGATCLLTFHFLSLKDRRLALSGLRDRLKPGASLIVSHLSLPTDADERDVWLTRYSRFASPGEVSSEQLAATRAAMQSRLTIVTPEEDEGLLREAGFSKVRLFYAGFAFRGWVASA